MYFEKLCQLPLSSSQTWHRLRPWFPKLVHCRASQPRSASSGIWEMAGTPLLEQLLSLPKIISKSKSIEIYINVNGMNWSETTRVRRRGKNPEETWQSFLRQCSVSISHGSMCSPARCVPPELKICEGTWPHHFLLFLWILNENALSDWFTHISLHSGLGRASWIPGFGASAPLWFHWAACFHRGR